MGDGPAIITARPAAGLLLWAAGEGVDAPALLSTLELDPMVLQDPDGRIPLDRFYDLLERLARALDGPDMGLRFCRAMDLRKWERANVLQTASATIGAGFERMLRYLPLWNSHERIWLERRGPEAAVLYAPHGRKRPAHRIKAEMTFADIVIAGRQLAEQPYGLVGVRFRHRRPPSIALHEQIFAAPIEFGAPVDELVFDARLLDVPLATSNPHALAFIERQLDAQLQALPRGFVDRAREVLSGLLVEDRTLAGLARRLATTPRTLQRQLQAAGTTHQRLLDDARRELALRHLGNRAAIAETAFLLGFSEPSAFHRAFKRWTGTTPQAYQSRLR